MALSKITYDTKVALDPQPSVANINKVSDSDMNEIKSVVNDAIDKIESPQTTRTTSNTDTYSCNFINGVELFYNSSGTTGQVDLSDSVANYEYIEIFYKQQEYTPIFSSVKVYKPSNTQVCLVSMQPGNGGTGIVAAYVLVSGTTITKQDYNIFWTNGGNQHTDKIYITRVMGYK